MIKKIIENGIVGIGIAFIVSNIMIGIFMGSVETQMVINSYVLWMIAGFFYGVASMIYDTKLNRVIAVPVHIVVNLSISFIAIEIMFRKIINIDPDFNYLFILIIFIIIYLCISAGIYIFERIGVKELNKKINKKNKGGDEDEL